jgi:Pyruvate/2-oxoacid:ferredoxin oxidoreductase gamma subunit
MRSGTSNCHVRLSKHPVDSPLVSRPNVLLALNEPSLHKFIDTVEPGGWVLYNGSELPADIRRTDVRWIVRPFVELADHVGDTRVGNILMLGSLLEVTGMLGEAEVDSALRKHVKTQRWLDLDRKALIRGREAVREGVPA